LHQGVVRGRRYAHNPEGRDALALLSARAARILDNADGRPLGALARDLGEPLDACARELPLLTRNGFVVTPDLPMSLRPKVIAPVKARDVWVHITNDCNLDCPHCYVGRSHESLSDAHADALVESLARSAAEDGVTRVRARYAGGEPLLHLDRVRRLHARARARLYALGCAYDAAVLTNGTLVTDDAAAWLRDEGVSVSVSLDGIGEVHDRARPTRGGGGSFAQTAAGIARLRQVGVEPYVLVTVSESNLDGVPALTDWLLAEGLAFRYSLVRDLEAGDALLRGRGAGWHRPGELIPLRRKEMNPNGAPVLEGEALHRLQATFARCYARIEAALPTPRSFWRTHGFCDLSWRRPLRSACGAGTSGGALSHDGRLSPCHATLHHPGALALDPSRGFDANLQAQRQLPRWLRDAPNATCAACAWRRSCAGGCPLLLHRRDGDVQGRSPYCELFRAVLPRILRIGALELMLRARRDGALPLAEAVERAG
jgi:uncharacterized protein